MPNEPPKQWIHTVIETDGAIVRIMGIRGDQFPTLHVPVGFRMVLTTIHGLIRVEIASEDFQVAGLPVNIEISKPGPLKIVPLAPRGAPPEQTGATVVVVMVPCE